MKVIIQLNVDDSLAADLRVFLAKVQRGDAISACAHARSIGFLGALPRQIENAPGYAHAIHQQQQTSAGA